MFTLFFSRRLVPFKLLLALLWLAFCLPVCGAIETSPASTSCTEPDYENLLKLDLSTFDADPKLGWQQFSQLGCIGTAIAVLERYIAEHGNSYRLAFHLARQLLLLDQNQGARQALFRSLRSDLKKDNPFKWNDYVLGYIAYIDGDVKALDFYIQQLERNMDNKGNAVNRKILKRLRENIALPYSKIYADPPNP